VVPSALSLTRCLREILFFQGLFFSLVIVISSGSELYDRSRVPAATPRSAVSNIPKDSNQIE
jgi:hypothetical protein